jgi:hypothetical protein
MFRENTFSGGTDGVTISTGNSGGVSGDAINSVAGTPKFENAHATGLRGPMHALITASSTDVISWTSVSLSGRDLYTRMYAYVTANPGVLDYWQFPRVAPSTDLAQMYVSTTGKLSIRKAGSGTDLALTTNSIALNQWIRVEANYHFGTTSGNGSCEIRLFNDADSDTATEVATSSSIDLGTSLPDTLAFSYHTGMTSFEMDDIAMSDVGFIGPLFTRRVVQTYSAAIQQASW